MIYQRYIIVLVPVLFFSFDHYSSPQTENSNANQVRLFID